MCKEGLTLWKTCSLRMSCNLAFKSLTLCTISESLPLSVLSIWLVSPVARSNDNLIPPTGIPLANQPPSVPACAGVKQIRWSPDSAALNVKRPSEEPRVFTTRWSFWKVSSTATDITKELDGSNVWVLGLKTSALYFPRKIPPVSTQVCRVQAR